MIALDICVEGGGWDLTDALSSRLDAAAAAAATAGGRHAPAAATLLLADDETLRDLNHRWRGKDAPTNVLSFPAAAPTLPGMPPHLGDIAIAYETVAREAEAEGKSMDDHLAHLVVHGVLHLLGHDHEGDGEAEAMERAERGALASIGIADPYRDTVPGRAG